MKPHRVTRGLVASLLLVLAACRPADIGGASEDVSAGSSASESSTPTQSETESEAESADGETSSVDSETSADTSTETGSETETSSSDSETDTGEDPICDEIALVQCKSQTWNDEHDCLAACDELTIDCEDEACHWACKTQRQLDEWACAALHCPGPHEVWEQCPYDCHAAALACAEAPTCEALVCSFDEMTCMDENCHPCEELTLGVAWAGSCEIQLPGPVPPVKLEFSAVEVGFDGFSYVVESDSACGDPWVWAVWADANGDHISLCDEACAMFEQQGQAELRFGVPDCE